MASRNNSGDGKVIPGPGSDKPQRLQQQQRLPTKAETDTAGLFQFGEVLRDLFVRERIVLQVAGKVFIIGGHVDQAVAREVEQDHLLLAGLLAFVGLFDRRGNRMARLGSRDDALGLCEEGSRVELSSWSMSTASISLSFSSCDTITPAPW